MKTEESVRQEIDRKLEVGKEEQARIQAEEDLENVEPGQMAFEGFAVDRVKTKFGSAEFGDLPQFNLRDTAKFEVYARIDAVNFRDRDGISRVQQFTILSAIYDPEWDGEIPRQEKSE